MCAQKGSKQVPYVNFCIPFLTMKKYAEHFWTNSKKKKNNSILFHISTYIHWERFEFNDIDFDNNYVKLNFYFRLLASNIHQPCRCKCTHIHIIYITYIYEAIYGWQRNDVSTLISF